MNYTNRYIIAAIGIIVVIIIYYVFTHKKPSITCSPQAPTGNCPAGQTCITGECLPSKNLLFNISSDGTLFDFSNVDPSPINNIGMYIAIPNAKAQQWTITNNGSSYQLQNIMTGNCLYMNSATDYGVTKCGSPGTSWDISPGVQITNKATSQCLTYDGSGNVGAGNIIPTVCGDSSQTILVPINV